MKLNLFAAPGVLELPSSSDMPWLVHWEGYVLSADWNLPSGL
jgi:hypothetical protein